MFLRYFNISHLNISKLHTDLLLNAFILLVPLSEIIYFFSSYVFKKDIF